MISTHKLTLPLPTNASTQKLQNLVYTVIAM